MSSTRVPVLEIGGTHVSAAVVETGSWRVVTGTATRSDLDAGGTADEIVDTLVAAARSLPFDVAPAWGIALPGPFDYARGIGDYRGVGKFDALRDVDLGERLRSRLGLPAGAVRFVNDAVAFTVGEWLAGAARGHRRAIGVTVGTGVGSAFLADGRACRRGPGVPPQGRLDLLEFAGRPLEDTVSRRAIRARYAALAGPDAAIEPDVREIAARARAGDGDANQAIAAPLRALGRVLGPLAEHFRAGVVVLGGSISLAWDVGEAAVHAGLSETWPAWPGAVQVAPAARIHDAALLGAAWPAVHPVAKGPHPAGDR